MSQVINKNAVIYCRKSSKSFKKFNNELSLDRQETICREYCITNLYTVKTVYSEITSARNMEDMKEFSKLLNEVENDDQIIVSDVSRFSRNLAQAVDRLEILRDYGIFVHSVTNMACYDNNSTNRFQFRSYLNQAQFESDQISDRMKNSISYRKKNGHKIGRAAFGYECFNNNGIRSQRLHSTEQEVIKIIKYMKNKYSVQDICDYLNDNGYDFRGKVWTCQRINYVLKIKARVIDIHLTGSVTNTGR